MKKRYLPLALGLFAIVALFAIVGCGGNDATTTTAGQDGEGTASTEATTSGETVEFQFVSFLAANDPVSNKMIPEWIKRVSDATAGTVKVTWKGGSEVIPGTDQIEAVRNGVVDGSFIATSWYESLAHEMQAMSLSEYTPWEERENGYFDYFAKRHENIGVVYLGRWMSGYGFNIWTSKPVDSPEDLKGMKLRTRAGHLDGFLKALGVDAVSVDPGEVYTALERNIVEGFSYVPLGPRTDGWTEKVKYVIDHSVFDSQNATIIMNPDSWAKLSPQQQEQVMKATAEFEHWMYDALQQMQAEERPLLEADGVTFIKFAPDVAEEFTKLAADVGWQYLKEQIPDQAAEIEKLSRKPAS